MKFLYLYCLLQLLFLFHSCSFPLCTDLRAAFKINGSLEFCNYSGKACCSASQDGQLQKRFEAMNISDPSCASAVKSILCATPSLTLAHSQHSATPPTPPPTGLCLEKIGNGSYINMAPHPDGSSRAFFSNLAGKVWLASIPEQDSGEVMGLDESSPFVDLTDQVYLDTNFGMMGLAFHPDFAVNGRFFASYNCDREKSPACGGRCTCNSDVNCDPSTIQVPGAGEVCRYQSVIAEYSANGTGSSPSEAKTARPQEVRRIITLGLPFTSDHGGQILFSPADGYLYFMMGDGGSKGDPYNFAQNKKSLLGKIMRLDVDNIPSEEELVKLGRWGNYSVPRDNPFSEDKEMQPEIWAYGLRNPWRCSFDSERPSYFMCADVGQDQYEEVDIISKGGNYGWRVYEGPLTFNPQSSPGGNTSADSIDTIFPVLGYSHSKINKLGSAAISGGYFYRSQADPCTYGSYLYADLYASHIWAAQETPGNSGNFTAKDVSFSCASDSPIKCDTVPNSRLPALQYIFSFGEDNRKDVFILTQSGVYRVVRPSRCNYACSKEVKASVSSPRAAPSRGQCLHPQPPVVGFVFVCILLLFLGVL
ncbi:HIPL1 protein [Striga asiatica]|uniref:HIPL1 protein n=1 Tax=Striga asiatica TaxID=4170 RepID=A0A5A7PHC8_STRAF|nr:HIPL1 protein [Striga asiatica]